MTEDSDPSCPHCASQALNCLGRLPDSEWFAGKKLEEPLSGGKLYQCCRCRLKFRYPVHDTTTYLQLYDNAAVSTWRRDTARADWDLIVSYIQQRLPEGGRVLDFGCYTGGLLDRLGSAYERHGVEINKAACALATADGIGHIWSSLEEIPRQLRFDVIIASDVIEHISDPGQLIDRLLTHVTDVGAVIITTGDAHSDLWNRFKANWWYCFYPEHISFLSKAWLDNFSHSRGLSIEHCDRFNYLNLPRGRRFFATVLTYLYGYFPRVYFRFRNTVRQIFGHPTLISAPGIGISADHLFIVLIRNGKQQ